jgi:voltage-gated potassium channel
MKRQNLLDTPFAAKAVVVLILYSVVCFTIETLPNLGPALTHFLYWSEIVVVAIFSVEYIYRVFVANKKLSYVFSFHGLIDLLAVLPFYLALAIDLRSVRLLRLFRLVRLLKLAKYSESIARFKAAIALAKEDLILYLFATLILLYLAAFGIFHFEHIAQPEQFGSMFDALWWAVVTITTVGYGDVYPITTGGRIFTFFVLVLGLGLVAVPAGIFASSISSLKRTRRDPSTLNTPDD